MPTRFYLPETLAAPAAPAFSALWEDTANAARRGMVTVPTDSLITSLTDLDKQSTALPSDALARQYVSEPLHAGNISGTFSLAIGARETSTGYNAWLQVRISVVSNDGSVERGVLYAGQTQTSESATTTDPNYEFATSTNHLSRYLDTVALSTVTALEDDRIVVEIGTRLSTLTTGTGMVRFRFGDPASAPGDLQLLPDVPSANERPWIEFSATLPLAIPVPVELAGTIAPPTGSFAVGTTSDPVGTDVDPELGIDIDGVGVVDYTGPIVSPPASTAPAARDVAYVIDSVTLAAGLKPDVVERKAFAPRARYRVVVDGVDITYFRGATTPFPDYQLTDPWSFGTGSLRIPQVVPCYEPEELGTGDLSWCREGALVLVQRVDPATELVAGTDYRGIVVNVGISGDALTLTLAGEAQARAALSWRPPPTHHALRDLGMLLWGSIGVWLRLPFKTFGGPVTGVRRYRAGGTYEYEIVNGYLAETQLTTGQRRTLRYDEATGTWDAPIKDTATVAATIYTDRERYVADLSSDLSEKPNRIYGNAVTPNGQRFNNAKAPNLVIGDPIAYPMAGGAAFGIGTTDAETVSGSGITSMVYRLFGAGFLEFAEAPGGYDADCAAAIRELQRAAGLPRTGIMTTATWDALWDTDITGFSWAKSKVLPMAERDEVRVYNYTATGAIIGNNPAYRQAVVPVSKPIDFPPGFTKQQVRSYCAGELWDGEPMWTGSIEVNSCAVVRGTHNPGDPLDSAGVMNVRELRPGTNVWLPTFQGGVTAHIVSIDVTGESSARLTIDTHARDAAEVWEVIARNRESRRSRHRAWLQDYRGSMRVKDTTTGWLDFAGLIEGEGKTLKGGRWNVFVVPAGEEGSLRRQRYRTNPNAEFVVALFGRSVTEEALNRRIPHPLANAAPWESNAQRDWLQDRVWLDAYGTPEQPCGYWPTKKSGGLEPATLTGKYEHNKSVEFHTFNRQACLWVAVFPDRDCVIPPGRIWWPLLEDGI